MGSDLVYRRNGIQQQQQPLEESENESGFLQSPSLSSPTASQKQSRRFYTPIRYLFAHERFLFLLVGIAIAALFFLLPQPTIRHQVRSPNSIISIDNPIISLSAVGSGYKSAFGVGTGLDRVVGPGRVPLGLKRKGLRILVTGGAGFVGSHLVDRLIERGDSVIVVDNYFTGRKENVYHHFGNPNFELIRHDVVEPILLEVDQIYHLACPASPVHYKYNPVKTIISFLCCLYYKYNPVNTTAVASYLYESLCFCVDFLRRVSLLVLCPHFVFLIGNAIILTLLLHSSNSSTTTTASHSTDGNRYESIDSTRLKEFETESTTISVTDQIIAADNNTTAVPEPEVECDGTLIVKNKEEEVVDEILKRRCLFGKRRTRSAEFEVVHLKEQSNDVVRSEKVEYRRSEIEAMWVNGLWPVMMG